MNMNNVHSYAVRTVSILVLVCCFCPVWDVPAASPEALYESLVDQVVLIETFDDLHRPLKQGSGVVLGRSLCITSPGISFDPAYQRADTNGIDILSNSHVITFAKQIFVQMKNGKRCLAAPVFADSGKDLTILRTVEPLNARFAEFSKAPRVGQKVYAIGAPKGLGWTFSEGLVSGLREQGGNRLIQTTAPISPGSSGGGLFDENGKLVGITTLQVEEGQNLNFAISLGNDERAELAEARKGHSLRPGGIEYEDWVVGVIKLPARSDGSWREMHPKWQEWRRLNAPHQQIGKYQLDDFKKRQMQKLSDHAYFTVGSAASTLRNYYLAERYFAFPLDIEGHLAAIHLEKEAAERLRTDSLDPIRSAPYIESLVRRRRALIQSIPKEFKNRIEVVALHFYEAIIDRPNLAFEILSKFVQDLPDKPKDNSFESGQLKARVEFLIGREIHGMSTLLEGAYPRLDNSSVKSVLREKGWSARADRPEK